MALVEKTVLIDRSAQQMFDLVDRVEDYPQFLPWCGGTELLRRTDTITAARIHIRYRGITSAFATENTKEIPKRMDIAFREGPFSRLQGSWQFTPLADKACKVAFQLEYQFASKLLEKVLGPVFNQITNTFVDSFVKRAQEIYG